MKPYDNQNMLLSIKRALETYELEDQKESLIEDLRKTNYALQDAMRNLHTIEITAGVHWVEVPEVNLFILCGCPADVVKLMMKKGLISITKKGECSFETGPNVILLSDVLIQNGFFSNLSEFPVLQMLYRQGMILPGHPNNTGIKPILVGTKAQVNAQMEYIYRGNYGLNSREEIIQTGVSEEQADELMALKMKFAFGKIRKTEELLDSRIVEDKPVEIRDGVFVQRQGFNKYRFAFKEKSVDIDLNLKPHEHYEPPYPLGFYRIDHEFFGVVHKGEGDGWDTQRPCISSIIIYQGKIYLIDVGPNILHTLKALSIGISEIEGIFHTHAHDDHFAGLPTLMHSDHRLKYYATSLVQASVAKKFSALMAIDESKFFEYFDVHLLDFDRWNDIDGLEVKPIYSPHPVETNIFVFRSLGADGYKSYAHFADITGLNILENMIKKDSESEGISRAFFEKIKADYLIPADIKKLDIGGGLIHGQTSDFKDDKSNEIILAHISSPLAEEEKEIGSERAFGAMDVLIPSKQNYLRKWSALSLKEYFPGIDLDQLRALLNAPMVSFNPGALIQKKGSKTSYIYFILTGMVEFIMSENKIQNYLYNGCFIGDMAFLQKLPSSGTWRAVSYVQALRFTTSLYSTFLKKYGLSEKIKTILNKIDFLLKTSLFGEGLSYPVQNKVAQAMDLHSYEKGEQISIQNLPGLYLVKQGELSISNSKGEVVESLKNGDFCGEESFFNKCLYNSTIKVTSPSEVYFIHQKYPLLEIPIVHWKLMELQEKRLRMFVS